MLGAVGSTSFGHPRTDASRVQSVEEEIDESTSRVRPFPSLFTIKNVESERVV